MTIYTRVVAAGSTAYQSPSPSSPDANAVLMVSSQLFGLREKLVETALRLVDIHLSRHEGQAALGSLRTASRHLADARNLARYVDRS